MSKLPSEIIVDILSRLPVKSLLRFRCVCKSWCAIVSDPHFVKMHLNRATEIGNTNLILTSGAKLYSLDCDEPTQFDLPFMTELLSIAVLGSCNGLVCLSDYANFGNISYIWNPDTREYKKLPNPPSKDGRLIFGFSILGFGHNAITDEFKLVRVTNLCHFEACLGPWAK
ncbi:hypothetical protein HHK36_002200 [Tetracentron sinense]|uniref:F-box domain-containing protein n=1 Tax=Tetracentron sinense TaxID=13715 RepID=A0A834ZUQ2_TETSI|nr:hypothetical protein HHK36_002200 [Tetracentron sinense]